MESLDVDAFITVVRLRTGRGGRPLHERVLDHAVGIEHVVLDLMNVTLGSWNVRDLTTLLLRLRNKRVYLLNVTERDRSTIGMMPPNLAVSVIDKLADVPT